MWLGQNAEVVRAVDGIHVTTVVPTDDRKSTLNRSFEELIRDSAVTLDVSVTGDAGTAPADLDLASVFASPAYPVLRSLLGAAVPDASHDESIRAFASGVIAAVARRQDRLKALTTLIDRWPDERLQDLPLESVVTWQLMVQEHAEAIRHQTELLRVQIGPWFRVATVPPRLSRDAPASLSSVKAAAETAAQLVALAADEDEALRVAFMPCLSGVCPPLDINRVMQSFTALEAAASRFAQFYVKAGRGLHIEPPKTAGVVPGGPRP
jgi:hypothetical protein